MANITKSLKIGLVLDTSLDPPDGVQQYVIIVGEWLRSQGHDVHYLVGQTKERQLPNIHSLARNISVRFNGNRTTIPLPTNKKRLKEFLRLQQFDVLHVQIPHSPFMAQRLILAASTETAIVGTFHILPFGKLARYGNRALGIWLKPSLKRFDQIISVSEAASKFATQTFKVDSMVIPNAIDYERFNKAAALNEYKNITILFLGRLVRRKGCDALLKAIALIRTQTDLPTFEVMICGKGPLLPSLKTYANTNGVGDIVKFVGFVSETDKPRYYASADISVFPSSGGESFGIVLLEAMASGSAAVLAGNNPGYRSVLGIKPQLLFDPANAQQLANKIEEFLRDANIRHDTARWGEAYSKEFDINVIGPKLLDVYKRALHKRREL